MTSTVVGGFVLLIEGKKDSGTAGSREEPPASNDKQADVDAEHHGQHIRHP